MTCENGKHAYELVEEYSGYTVQTIRKVYVADSDGIREIHVDGNAEFSLPTNSEDCDITIQPGVTRTDEMTEMKGTYLECRWCYDIPVVNTIETE